MRPRFNKDSDKKTRKYSFLELGMLFGMIVGSGLGTIFFASTDNAAFFSLTGIGLALGLSLGAAYDGYQKSKQKSEQKENQEEQ